MARTTDQAYELKWLTGVAKGHVDILSFALFADEVRSVDTTHDIRHPEGGVYPALCRLSVEAQSATLDYTPAEFNAQNAKHGIVSGLVTLRFTNESRQQIDAVLWNLERLSSRDIECRVVPWKPKNILESGEIKFSLQRQRPVQGLFRELLMQSVRREVLHHGVRCRSCTGGGTCCSICRWWKGGQPWQERLAVTC
jgi:hypothetical protein